MGQGGREGKEAKKRNIIFKIVAVATAAGAQPCWGPWEMAQETWLDSPYPRGE